MKIKWFRVWKMEGKTLKESWLIALHDPFWWTMIAILIISILLYINL